MFSNIFLKALTMGFIKYQAIHKITNHTFLSYLLCEVRIPDKIPFQTNKKFRFSFHACCCYSFFVCLHSATTYYYTLLSWAGHVIVDVFCACMSRARVILLYPNHVALYPLYTLITYNYARQRRLTQQP